MEVEKSKQELVRARHFKEDSGRMHPNQGCINTLIFKRKTNNFSQCLRKINGRLYIHLPSFDKWISQQTVQ